MGSCVGNRRGGVGVADMTAAQVARWRTIAIGLFFIVVFGNGIMLFLFQQEQATLDRIVEENAQRAISFCDDRNRENEVIAKIMERLVAALEADGNPQSAEVLRNPPEGFGARPIECDQIAITEEP